jgi:hypothetical protein
MLHFTSIQLKRKILMSWFAKLKQYAITGISGIGRSIYAIGQTYFSTKDFWGYVFKKPTPTLTLTTSMIGGAGNVGTALIGRIPAVYYSLGPLPETPVIETPAPLNTAGKIISGFLKGSCTINLVMNSAIAYFGTIALGELICSALDADPHSAAWKEAVLQISSIMVALGTFSSTYFYDFKQQTANAHAMAKSISEGLPVNRANAIKTAAVAIGPLISFPMQAAYWGIFSLSQIPTLMKSLGLTGIKIISGTAAFNTLIATTTLIPSIYKSLDSPESGNLKKTCIAKGLQFTAYSAGIFDSLAAAFQGFTGTVVPAKVLFNLNPYNPALITTATLLAVDVGIVNFIFAADQGYKNTLKYLTPAADIDIEKGEQTTLLSKESKKHACPRLFSRTPPKESDYPSATLAQGLTV